MEYRVLFIFKSSKNKERKVYGHLLFFFPSKKMMSLLASHEIDGMLKTFNSKWDCNLRDKLIQWFYT